MECLTKDRDARLAFYDFPAEHWDHVRTSNPIESVFATVRHRTFRTNIPLPCSEKRGGVFHPPHFMRRNLGLSGVRLSGAR